jgi:hypothetical protein
MSTTQPETSNFDRPMRIAFIVGAVAALISVAGLIIFGPGQFFQAYLYSYLFWLGISLGLFGMLMLHFLVSSRWGLTIRRVMEAGAGTIWALAILFIPVIIGLPFLFPWARPAEVAKDAGMQYQSWYLNVPFFIIRAVIYFAVWILLAFFANRMVARLGKSPSGDQDLRGRLKGLGAGGAILYAFSMFFASVDWLMSLQPSWVSTAIGMITVIGQVLGALAFAILMLNLFPSLSLGLGRRWRYDTTPVPYQDLGALSITLVMAWAYLSFFQLLIQWAGNIPREVVWYIARTNGGWSVVAWLIAIFEFILPFAILLTIRVRHNLRLLGGVSIMLLIANLVIYFWHVKPAFYPDGFAISLMDIVMPFAIGGIWAGVFFYTLKRRPALSAADQAVLNLTGGEEPALPHRNEA